MLNFELYMSKLINFKIDFDEVIDYNKIVDFIQLFY